MILTDTIIFATMPPNPENRNANLKYSILISESVNIMKAVK